MSSKKIEDYKKLKSFWKEHQASLSIEKNKLMKETADKIKVVFKLIENDVDVDKADSERNKEHDKAIDDKKKKEQESADERAKEYKRMLNENYIKSCFEWIKDKYTPISAFVGVIEKIIANNYGPENNYKIIDGAIRRIGWAIEGKNEKALSQNDISSINDIKKKINIDTFNEDLLGSNFTVIKEEFKKLLDCIDETTF